MLVKRLATLMGTALLTGGMLSAPAQAAAFYSCVEGTRWESQGAYNVLGEHCIGTGNFDVEMRVYQGPAAGTYQCRIAYFSYDLRRASGAGCVPK
ncbi:hypothetical protein [Nonomuraea typhae]|uniref:hypothetical protein n=1 Tax=Nonomuraea typhae TaxID=2603600 RepID=UPI0012FCF5A4|nr:hypothetical protein [Nonomuraea typhae]